MGSGSISDIIGFGANEKSTCVPTEKTKPAIFLFALPKGTITRQPTLISCISTGGTEYEYSLSNVTDVFSTATKAIKLVFSSKLLVGAVEFTAYISCVIHSPSLKLYFFIKP